MEDNLCPSHLSLSSSLLLISSLKGDQLVHFFHDNIAEASHSLISHFQISFEEISWMLCRRIFPMEVSLAIPWVLLSSSHCIPCFVLPVHPSLPVCALGSREFVYLLWLCYIWPAALFFKRRLSELFSTHSQISYAISPLFLQDM